MNIVIPTADYPPIEGGIGSVSLHLARELAALGNEVTVIAPWFPDMEERDARESYRVVRYKGYRLGWLRFFPMLAKSRKWIRKSDLVMGINISYGAVMSWMLRKPYIAFGYAYEFLKFKRMPLFSTLLRRVYNKASQVIAISHYTANELQQFGVRSNQISVIFPGAPTARVVTPKEIEDIKEELILDDGPLILAVGRLIPRKGHGALVNAFAPILEKYPDARLVCVGRGPSSADAARAAQELGIREALRLPGRLSNRKIAALYTLCDVFALPTGVDRNGQVEGFGLVFVEAGAYGKPVVAGRSGGVVDAVVDGTTGRIVDPTDINEISVAIQYFLDRPATAKKMGDAGKLRVETELNWTVFTRKLMEQVENVS
jgi:phosphatidylinositol alpha-1,6-mannosyltransferase